MSGKTPSVKAAAAEALAVLAFVGSEHPSDSLEVAQHLQSLWKGNAHPLAAAASGRITADTWHACKRALTCCRAVEARY